MKTVFTNGVFDLLHVGHLRNLKWCATFGRLVVGINSDASARRLKPGRPLLNQDLRKEQLLSLRCVDDVIIFDESNAARVIDELRPDVYVKGADYQGIVTEESALVLDYGGSVEYARFEEGFSTTQLIKYIRNEVSSFP